VDARVALDPPQAARDAEWFNITAWQGGGSVVEPLAERSPGVYEAEGPVPVHGEWKALIRLHRGRSLVAVPVYLPRDPAIPAPAVPARSDFSRPFTSDKRIVLREARDVPASLTFGATGAILLLAAAWVMTLTWGLRRLEGPGSGGRRRVPGHAGSNLPSSGAREGSLRRN
ncbi:MAG: hypothetical protein ACRDJ5_02090, partial [Actinomycetota bacterium]